MAIPRMRTAAKVVEEIRALDPGSELSLNYVRRIIRLGAVPVVECGRKKLVNVDDVIALLENGCDLDELEAQQKYGQIRRVAI